MAAMQISSLCSAQGSAQASGSTQASSQAEVLHYQRRYPQCGAVLPLLAEKFEEIAPFEIEHCEIEVRFGYIDARWNNGVTAAHYGEITNNLQEFFGPQPVVQVADYFFSSGSTSYRTRVTPESIVTVAKERVWYTDLQCAFDGSSIPPEGENLRCNALRVQISREIPATPEITLVDPTAVRIKHVRSFECNDTWRFDLSEVREGASFNLAEQSRPRYEVEIELIRPDPGLTYPRMLLHLLLKSLDFLPPFTTLHLPSRCAPHY